MRRRIPCLTLPAVLLAGLFMAGCAANGPELAGTTGNPSVAGSIPTSAAEAPRQLHQADPLPPEENLQPEEETLQLQAPPPDPTPLPTELSALDGQPAQAPVPEVDDNEPPLVGAYDETIIREITDQREKPPQPAIPARVAQPGGALPVAVAAPPEKTTAMADAVPPEPAAIDDLSLELLPRQTSTAAGTVPLPEAVAPPAAPAEPAALYDFPVEFNAKVQGYIELFQTVRRPVFERCLSRSRIYEKRMKEIFAEEGLPTDLYYLALIESGYNPGAFSRAAAMGVWQFIESTGRIYDLKRDWWIDERRSLEKSTRAAARHLRDLYTEMGDWKLALASYNAGINRVKRERERVGSQDFWKYAALPAQTKNYVPAFMAAVIIAKEHEKYGFSTQFEPTVEYELVTVDECTAVDVIAQCCGADPDVVRELNPDLRRWCTPPQTAYTVAVPKGTAELFRANYALLPADKKVAWRHYRIAKGDSFSAIARKYGTSVNAILDVNRLKASAMLRVGDYLVIPVPAAGEVPGSERQRVASYVQPKTAADGKAVKVNYRIRQGDNLWDISQRYGVSVEDLREWNHWVNGGIMHPGDLIVVWAPQGAPEKTAATARKGEKVTYEVKKGDTLWSIAKRFDADLDVIRKVNKLGTDAALVPGATLTIPSGSNL